MCFFKKKNKGEKPSKFVEFVFTSDGKTALVSGIKKGYNEGARLVIPGVFKGKPVKGCNTPIDLPFGIETVVFPDSFDYIGGRFFPKAKKFEVSPNHQKYACVNGLITSKDGKTLLAIPGALERLDKSKLEGTAIEALEPEAWFECRQLKSIEVPSQAHINNKPGEWLYDNDSFETFVFEGDQSQWGYEDGLLYHRMISTFKLVVNPATEVVFKANLATRVLLDPGQKNVSFNKRSQAETLVFEEGITEIDGDISLFPKVKAVYLPVSLEKMYPGFLAKAKNVEVYYRGSRDQLLAHVEKAIARPEQSWNYIFNHGVKDPD